MKAVSVIALATVVLACGCGTSRYRVLMSGIGSGSGGESGRKFRLFPCCKNADGTYARASASDCRFVAQEAAKYPDVFSDDGEVVRIRALLMKNYSDGHGGKTSFKSNSMSGPVALWNVLSAFTICTLPFFSEDEHAYRIALEFESDKFEELGVQPRCYDFVGYNQQTVSLVPLLGWCFPYGKPDDTEFYRCSMDVAEENDVRNFEVFWRAAVARAATELRKAGREIEFRQREAERRAKAKNAETSQKPVAVEPTTASPVPEPARSAGESAPAISMEEIPL